jgi:hypothetical protein
MRGRRTRFQRISSCTITGQSLALTRPKLGFELGAGEKNGQISEACPVGEGRKFSGELGNIGRGAVRVLDKLRDFNRFRGFFGGRNTA